MKIAYRFEVYSCCSCPLFEFFNEYKPTCRHPFGDRPEQGSEHLGEESEGKFPEKCPLRRGNLWIGMKT